MHVRALHNACTYLFSFYVATESGEISTESVPAEDMAKGPPAPTSAESEPAADTDVNPKTAAETAPKAAEPTGETKPTLQSAGETEPTLEPAGETEPTLEPAGETEPTLESAAGTEPSLEQPPTLELSTLESAGTAPLQTTSATAAPAAMDFTTDSSPAGSQTAKRAEETSEVHSDMPDECLLDMTLPSAGNNNVYNNGIVFYV